MTITVFGITFKPNVEDLRQSPSLDIVSRLSGRLSDSEILVVEPHVATLPVALESAPNVRLTDIVDGTERADIVLLLVDHDAFTTVDRERLKQKTVIDTRGFWR